MKHKLLIFSLVVGLLFSRIDAVYAQKNTEADIIEIYTTEEFLTFAEECRLDTYSIGKVVELKADISLSGTEFSSVPYFDGTFRGNGHTISGMYLDGIGSQLGLFRYIGVLGEVSDLNVKGYIVPYGSKTEIGGIAGVNYGTINNCTFKGNVYGEDTVGGIVGLNTLHGQILNCGSDAIVVATNNAGGIAGINKGTIGKCLSKSRVNIEELEPVLEIEGMDMGDLNIAQTVITRNNSGGIAGKSSGLINECYNIGTVGYQHVGYNAGGIAGYQDGVIEKSINYGEIYGRKDVGGIVGQAAPYVESDDYMSETMQEMEHSMNRIESTLNHLQHTMDEISSEAKEATNELNDMVSSNTGNLRQIGNTEGNVSTGDSVEDGNQTGTEETPENSESNGNEESTENGGSTENGDSTGNGGSDDSNSGGNLGDIEDFPELPDFSGLGNQLNNMQNAVQNTVTDLQEKAEVMEEKMNSIESDMNQITSQMAIMGETIADATEITIEDVSSVATADSMKGVVKDCTNYGVVNGDINVGGIAGIINIESTADPEEDIDISTDIARTTRINAVMLSDVNHGRINGKKDCVGGIAGLQSVGLIYGCEGYGSILTSAGNYVGGIVGQSAATVEKSYSVSDLSGKNYIGGIAGEGMTVTQCYSIAYIDSVGECLGAIAGNVKNEYSFKNNYFVKDRYEGIDNISYAGEAEPVAFKDIMLMEEIPEGFKQVKVSFVLEGEILAEEYVPYGTTLQRTQFPQLKDKEEAYAAWPEAEKYTCITNNLTLEAEYVPWVQSVKAYTETEEKPIFIVVGKFYEGTKLQLLPVEKGFPVTADKMKLLYSYNWSVLAESENDSERIEGHFYVPEGTEGEVQVYVKEGDGWIPVPTTIDGSYVVAEIPYEAAFAVVEIEPEYSGFYLTIMVAVVVFILVISMIIVHNKRRKKAKDDKKNDI